MAIYDDDLDEIESYEHDLDDLTIGARPVVLPTVSPIPEIVAPADWRVVESGQASVDLQGKILFVPFDATQDALSTRIHEYAHCKFSTGSAGKVAKKLSVPDKVIQACEDARVNLAYENLSSRGATVAKDPFQRGELPPLQWSKEVIDATLATRTTPADKALLAISLLGTKNSVASHLTSEMRIHLRCIREMMLQAMKKRGKPGRSCFSTRARNRIAKDIAARLGLDASAPKEPETAPESKTVSDLRSLARTTAMLAGATTADDLAKALRSRGRPEYYSDEDAPPAVFDDETHWGTMRVSALPLLSRVCGRFEGKRFRAADEGTELSYPERKPLDGRVFRIRARGSGATILIDASGSMEITGEEIRALLESAPGSVVAIYSGRTYESIDSEGTSGALHIIGRGKRAASSEAIDRCIVMVGCGNVVDGPALEWLAKQRTPRIWVSDGEVTGTGDHQAPHLFEDAANIVQDGRIMRIRDLPRTIAYLHSRALGARRKLIERKTDL
jgi:hypothetical protein